MMAAVLPFVLINETAQQFQRNGKTIVFHGVNIVKKTKDYLPSSQEFDPINSLNQEDMQIMQRLGVNLVRIGVMMDGVLTAEGQVDVAYLRRVEQLVNQLGSYGIYSLLDFHQDLLSPFACGEGIPAFLTDNDSNFPSPLGRFNYIESDSSTFKAFSGNVMKIRHALGFHDFPSRYECSKYNFGIFYITKYVNQLFAKLYDTRSGIFTGFSKYWSAVSKHFGNNEFVIGYDIINEPFPGDIYKSLWRALLPIKFERKVLQPFYDKIVSIIQQNDQNHLIFLEPSVINFKGTGLTLGAKQYYNYHLYCYFLDKRGDILSEALCKAQYYLLNYQRLGVSHFFRSPQFVSEFGASASTRKGLNALKYQIQLLSNSSWCYWQYKDFGDITTCFPLTEDDNEGLFNQSGQFMRAKAKILFHPYLQEFSGSLISQRFGYQSGELSIICRKGTGKVAISQLWELKSVSSRNCEFQLEGSELSILDSKSEACEVVFSFV